MEFEILPAQMKADKGFFTRLQSHPAFAGMPDTALEEFIGLCVYGYLPAGLALNTMVQDPIVQEQFASGLVGTGMDPVEVKTYLEGMLATFRRGSFAVLLDGTIDTWTISQRGERSHMYHSVAPDLFLDCPWDEYGYEDEYRTMTVTPCEMLVMGRKGFYFFAAKYPQIAFAVIDRYQEWLRWDFVRPLILKTDDACERVVRFLREQALIEIVGSSGGSLEALDTQTIAAAVDLSPDEVEDSVSHLVASGLLSQAPDTGALSIDVKEATDYLLGK